MILCNCKSQRELELKAIDLTQITKSQLVSLAVDVATDFHNRVLQNQFIVTDVFLQITAELADRCE